MKTLTVRVPKKQLTELIAEAQPGDVVVLTDGERNMTLVTNLAESGALDLDLNEDSPELAAELLKAARGPFTPYSHQDLEDVASQVLREKNRE
jgi:hypothetical protein